MQCSYRGLFVTCIIDYTIISHIRVFKYHRWTDFDILVGDALTLHCQDLCRRNTSLQSKPLSGCSSAGSLTGIPNGSGSNSNTNSPVCSSKQKLNRKPNPLEIIGTSLKCTHVQVFYACCEYNSLVVRMSGNLILIGNKVV